MQPCTNFYHLDHLTFEFDNTKFNLSPQAYLIYDPDEGACALLLTSLPEVIEDDLFLVGTTLLKHFYQVYDYEN